MRASTPIARQADITINDMPDEIVREIFINSDRLSSLHSLCLTSKRFRAITEPLLHNACITIDGNTPLRPLLRRVIEQPRLARELRYLDIRTLNGKSERTSFSQPSSESDLAVLKAAAEKIDLPRKGEWIEALNRGVNDAELALLLAHTPNIETINMEVWYQSNKFYTWEVIQQAGPAVSNPTLHGFSALRNISVAHADTEGGLNPAFLLDFMCLPSLRKIAGWACSWSFGGGESPAPESPRHISHVEDMIFEYSDFSDEAIEKLVGACKALKMFECRWGPAIVGAAEFEFPGLRRALISQKESLRTLVLDVREAFVVVEYGDEPRPDGIGSLKDFRALTKLEISAVLLIGEEDLNIEEDSNA